MTPIAQLKHLVEALAENLAAEERVFRQMGRVLEALAETETQTSSRFMDPHNPEAICIAAQQYPNDSIIGINEQLAKGNRK